MMVLLALMLSALPLLNGSFGASHDPVQNLSSQHRADQAAHAHEQPGGHSLDDGHTHSHDAGDHSHETAFLPPAAIGSGAGGSARSMDLDAAVRTPARGTRLDRPPKEMVTV